MTDIIDRIMSYEMGFMDDAETLKLFSELISNKMVWSMQGHYGRTASALIEDGWIDSDGSITDKAYDNDIL
jgi:hypothetical protein